MKDKFVDLKRSLIVLLLVLLLLPLILPPFMLHLFIYLYMYLILTLGIDLIMSSAGMWNFGYALFFGLGAYCTALITRGSYVSPWLSIPITTIILACVGAAIAYPTLRIKGFYYAIVTLVLAELARLIFKNLPVEMAGGTYGIVDVPTLSIGTIIFHSMHFCYLSLTVAIISFFFIHRLNISRFGRAFVAIREDEDLAECVGIDVLKYRVIVNMVSGALGGLAGTIYVLYTGFIDPAGFGWDYSFIPIAMALLGGRGIIGSILGTMILYFASEFLRGVFSPAVRLAFVGLIMAAVILIMPRGIYGARERIIKYLRGALT